jgi:hypothetical protein
MRKAIIVCDFAYKGTVRRGYGTGKSGLRKILQYLQYRDTRNNTLAKDRNFERWQDRGMGVHYREILQRCEDFKSKHVLAWTWVVSPDPELMALVPPKERRALLIDLTERVVEDYYTERGFDIPEYSFVLHTARTEPDADGQVFDHMHAHVVLPGTAPSVAERLPVYNNKERGHDALFRDVATKNFEIELDHTLGPEWRKLREQPEIANDGSIDLDQWFS